jgi:hypothetical protein
VYWRRIAHFAISYLTVIHASCSRGNAIRPTTAVTGVVLSLTPSRKRQVDLPRGLIDDRDLLFNHDVAESAKLRRELLDFGWKRIHLDIRRNHGIDGDEE